MSYNYDYDTMEFYATYSGITGLMTPTWAEVSNSFAGGPYWLGLQYYDKFETYTTPTLLNGKLSGDWKSTFPYIARQNTYPVTESCNYESFSIANLNGQSGGFWISSSYTFAGKTL